MRVRVRGQCLLACLLFLLAGAGCAGRGGHIVPEPIDDRPMPADPGERLRWALANRQSRERLAALAALEDSLRDLDSRLAQIVEDSAAHPVVRANAVALLGERHATSELGAFWTALGDRDPGVRASAAHALEGIIVVDQSAGIRLLRRALRDPEPAVQAEALRSLGDADVDLLHAYLDSGPPPELARIATDLIRSAEERGAPLRAIASRPAASPAGAGGAVRPERDALAKQAGAGAAGFVLERTAASGPRLEFRATRTWPQWDAAVGELVVTPPGGAPVILSSEVEVVGRVVPAFFSPDGRYLVYEAARQIRVRDLAGGEERVLGPGIAPRVVPFSDSFVFLREIPSQRQERRDEIDIGYTVYHAAFAGGEPKSVGVIRTVLRMDRRGMYSPARWMRVREREGVFVLEGESMGTFVLPDPFSSHAVDRG
ncbi:MAG TPA: HEAT repeat domain-containing protein [Longimicrobiales bacterium]